MHLKTLQPYFQQDPSASKYHIDVCQALTKPLIGGRPFCKGVTGLASLNAAYVLHM